MENSSESLLKLIAQSEQYRHSIMYEHHKLCNSLQKILTVMGDTTVRERLGVLFQEANNDIERYIKIIQSIEATILKVKEEMYQGDRDMLEIMMNQKINF